MLKYWAKSNFLLLHVSTSTQQEIIVPIRVWPAYSQTQPKYIYMLLAKTKARVDNTPKVMNKHSHRAVSYRYLIARAQSIHRHHQQYYS